MFRNALRRLLWLGPTLLLVTIPIFWAVTRSTDRLTASVAAQGEPPLPLFLNLNPSGVRARAEDAARRIARENDPLAAAELARYGGAALPHVLPLFDSLPPEARVRVALALSPIGRRMGVGAALELDSAEAAVLFWMRYWEEHSIDFRPAAVARSVRRFAERPSPLRRTEVLELDTFALESLIGAMEPPRSEADVARMRSLTEAAAHVTSVPLVIPEGASAAAAGEIVEEWRLYWLRHRSEFVAFTGVLRLGATLRETRYVRFLEQIERQGFGHTKDGEPVLRLLFARGKITLFLVLCALFAGYPMAAVIGLSRAVGGAGWNYLPLAAALVAAALTPLGMAGLLLAGVRATPSIGLAGIVMALGCGALAMRPARSLHDRAGELVHVRTPIAFGASRLRAALLSLRLSAPALIALAVSDLPMIATAAFVTERAFSLDGLGDVTARALRTSDLAWLMAVALLGTLLLGVSQIAADVVSDLLDPRREPARARRGRA